MAQAEFRGRRPGPSCYLSRKSRVIARGPEIILKINGVVMSHAVDRDREKACHSGVIALQMHPGPPMKVQFRNLRIKVLD